MPNLQARSLVSQRTHLIGVILANFSNPLYLTALDHFTRAARQLIDAGHSRLGFLGGPRSAATTQDRMKGFHAEIRDAGLEPGLVEFADAYT